MAVQAVLGALPAMPVPVVLDDQVVLVAVVDRTASLTASLTASVEVLLGVLLETAVGASNPGFGDVQGGAPNPL